MKKLLVIMNPIAGKGNATKLSPEVYKHKLEGVYDVSVIESRYHGHAGEISANAVKEGFEVVVAVGGDGTVNEVASKLVHTNTALGIVPAGSGNGYARQLGYAHHPEKAIQQIASAGRRKVDTFLINNKRGINVSGIGFDGYVAWKFNHEGKRGLHNYTRIALEEYFQYPGAVFEIEIDGIHISQFAHMLVIANAPEFGNAAIIAPNAEIADGKLDLVMVRKPPLYSLPATFFRMFKGSLKPNKFIQMYQFESLKIKTDRPLHLHIDGEAMDPVTELTVGISPSSLIILDPNTST